MSNQLKEILRVLYEHKDEWLSEIEIKRLCKIPGISVGRYAGVLLRNEWVYSPNGQGKIQISPEGESAYLQNI